MIKLHHLSLVTGITLVALSLTGVMTKIGDRIRTSVLSQSVQAQTDVSSPATKETSKLIPIIGL